MAAPSQHRYSSPNLLSRIKAKSKRAADVVPERFKRRVFWRDEWNVCDSEAKRLIAVAVGSGLMEKSTFRIIDDNGALRPTPHYAEVKK